MKCLSILPNDDIIITENLDMYKVHVHHTNTFYPKEKPDSEPNEIINYWLELLPTKSTINFKEMYGDDSRDNAKANFTNKTFPTYLDDKNVLWWDY
jgi:hypothetical protein